MLDGGWEISSVQRLGVFQVMYRRHLRRELGQDVQTVARKHGVGIDASRVVSRRRATRQRHQRVGRRARAKRVVLASRLAPIAPIAYTVFHSNGGV